MMALGYQEKVRIGFLCSLQGGSVVPDTFQMQLFYLALMVGNGKENRNVPVPVCAPMCICMNNKL